VSTIISIDGLRELEIKLAQLPAKLEQRIIRQAVAAGARVIQREARSRAPMSIAPHILRSYASAVFKKYTSGQFGTWVTPGNLKRMIRVRVDKSRTRGYAVTYEVYVKNKDAWYWKFVEFGTVKMSAKPFMRPAFETMKLAAINEIENQIKSRMENEGIS